MTTAILALSPDGLILLLKSYLPRFLNSPISERRDWLIIPMTARKTANSSIWTYFVCVLLYLVLFCEKALVCNASSFISLGIVTYVDQLW